VRGSGCGRPGAVSLKIWRPCAREGLIGGSNLDYSCPLRMRSSTLHEGLFAASTSVVSGFRRTKSQIESIICGRFATGGIERHENCEGCIVQRGQLEGSEKAALRRSTFQADQTPLDGKFHQAWNVFDAKLLHESAAVGLD
jgi:hypothetical protein